MKPMLAARVEDVTKLRFPLLASAKLDGVRAIVRNGCVLSRSLKPIPNRVVQDAFRHLENFDGELIVGSPTAPDVYRVTVSGVMSEAGTPPVAFMLFDNFADPNVPFSVRIREIPEHYALPQVWVRNLDEVTELEAGLLARGYEGLILRDPGGRYKFGRSTMNEQGMMKLKQFSDDEAVVVGFEELMHNANEATKNELGYTERSSHQANQVPMGKLGALVCEWQGKQFKIGTGFDDQDRQSIWDHRELHLGQQVKFKYLAIGMKDLPRHPVFLGFRQDPT